MKKLLIIDGMNLYFQMFFGMPSRIINKNGKAIQGVLGFVGALIKIIKMVNPTHFVVLFDGQHENYRTELLPQYKANRVDYNVLEEEKNPFSQLDYVYKALTFMGIKHCEVSELEADDTVASYVDAFQSECEIIISSFDSDFFQLMNNNVKILRYRGEKTIVCDSIFIKEKFNILPCQYVDFKCLTGDNADNIKGAEKVGLKTAASLINEFGNLKNILKNVHKIKKIPIKESILKNANRLKDNYSLIKLKNISKLPFLFDEIEYNYNGITSTEVLIGIGLK